MNTNLSNQCVVAPQTGGSMLVGLWSFGCAEENDTGPT
jgi:hypothetical protein